MLLFSVPGDPRPQPRVKAAVRGKHAHIYTPSHADDWKHDVRASAIEAIRERGGWTLVPPGVAVEVRLDFAFRRPKAHYRTGRFSDMLKASAPMRHAQLPDRDNCEKAVTDALGGFQGMPPLIWCDDRQIDGGEVRKRWADPGENPGVTILVVEEDQEATAC